MANIFDRGSTWELVIFPEITEAVEIIDEPEKGYRAVLGFNPTSGQHVVSSVTYSKNMYSIEDVLKKIEALRTCERCDTLDKDRLELESIQVPSAPVQASSQPPSLVSFGQAPEEIQNSHPVPVNAPLSQQVKPDVKDMFANLVLDAYLTNPGKYFLGLMLDDPALTESAYPRNPEAIPEFMGDMIGFMSGEMDFMRSPDEARDFLSVMRAEEEASRPGVPARNNKRLPSMTNNIVIY